MRCDSVCCNGFSVAGSGVAFVVFPPVGGVFTIQCGHDIVAVGFGQDRCCGNVEKAAVSFDDAAVWNWEQGVKPVAVYRNVFGWWVELFERAVHGLDGGIEDVHFIDLSGRTERHCKGDCYFFDDRPQLIPLLFG